MQTRFLLGPSGSGKTYRCVAEVQAALAESPQGCPLIFLAPRQATFQLERQVLANPALPGCVRLRILSFERLAESVLRQFRRGSPRLLTEEGRLMVLRALLTRRRNELNVFRAAARLKGFAQQLSRALREFQRAQLSPEQLLALSREAGGRHQLNLKLQDLALMLRAYLDWLEEQQLQDSDQLLSLAAQALHSGLPPGTTSAPDASPGARPFAFGTAEHGRGTSPPARLWLDGFAELSPQEMDFLMALLPFCERATLAFNLDREASEGASWLSAWSVVGHTCRQLRQRLAQRQGGEVVVEWLDPASSSTRFAGNPALRHLERHWADDAPCSAADPDPPAKSVIRLALCPDPEAEATVAAREILQFVRAGGQYRNAAVLVRNLEDYHDPVRRVFRAFGIPVFVDRREPVGHHPFVELTRSALRVVAFSWQTDDWFGALKTGLVPARDSELDRLENQALARGWKGQAWLEPFRIPDDPELAGRLEALRTRLVEPFQRLGSALGSHPTGPQLAEALASFWNVLQIADTLETWSARVPSPSLGEVSGSVHLTLWRQMQEWLDNLSLAFAAERLSLRDWLPIVEAGLADQTVGVIPPTLDQVLVGSIDRSRNPDLKLALLLGMNEGVFPAVPSDPDLLSHAEREQLLKLGLDLAGTVRHQLAREQYLGYVAFTRARERLVVTCALRDGSDKTLNPSPFLDRVRRLFPWLALEPAGGALPWTESEHLSELMAAALRAEHLPGTPPVPERILALPPIAQLRERVARFRASVANPRLSPALAEQLYGTTLETSVSRLEEYAACPFRFAVTSGLRAEERKMFRLDARQQGSFQHEVLARFHQELRHEGKRWRDLTAAQARDRIRAVAERLMPDYQLGLLHHDERNRFAARALVASLQDFIATVVEWMPQYEFDPHAVELAFGIEEKPLPAWEIDLGEGHRLSFRGKIDRIDLWRQPGEAAAWCVVIDYKSSARHLDPLLLAHGIQLQLPAYLNVLRALAHPEQVFGVRQLIPAGVFFVNLRGQYTAGKTRDDVLGGYGKARARAYRHCGRFDIRVLRQLDNRPHAATGDQFRYSLCENGRPDKRSDSLDFGLFNEMLQAVEGHLRRMGREIYAGTARLDPFRKGNDVACQKCEHKPICRIDPWTHSYRILQAQSKPAA